MREFINAISLLFEGTMETIEIRNSVIRVWINPSKKQFENIANHRELRGILDINDDLYVWDAGFGIHFEVANELGVQPKEYLKFWGRICFIHGMIDEDELRSIPIIQQIYQGVNFEVESMDDE